MKSTDYLDRTIFSVFLDENGDKMVHFLGYGYYTGEPDNKPYRFIEYAFFIAPLSNVLKEGFSEYEGEHSDQFKQYITDCDEKELVSFYEHYDSGKKPKEINELMLNTECGCYIW